MPDSNEDLYTTNDFSKRLFPNYVRDKERIVIDRRKFRMTRHPDSTENVEIIEINALPQKDDSKSGGLGS